VFVPIRLRGVNSARIEAKHVSQTSKKHATELHNATMELLLKNMVRLWKRTKVVKKMRYQYHILSGDRKHFLLDGGPGWAYLSDLGEGWGKDQ
jgi:hypothetical protein